jgi:hypothetical protein
LIVGDDLVHDAVDGLLAGVSGTGRQHIDRDRGQAHFAGGQRTALTIPNANNSRVLGVAHAGNRHQDTVFGNAGDERLAQGGVVATLSPMSSRPGSRCSSVPTGWPVLLSGASAMGVVLVMMNLPRWGRPGGRPFCLPSGNGDLAGMRAAECKVRARSFRARAREPSRKVREPCARSEAEAVALCAEDRRA